MTALDALLAGETTWPSEFPERLSPSSLALATGCPERWRRRYLLEEREPWGGAALIGLTVHRAAESVYRHKLETQENLSLSDMRELTAQAFEDKTLEAERDGITWNDVKPAEAKDLSVLLSTAYHPTTLTVEPVAVEEWVSCHIPGVEPEIIGRVDVRTTYGILDVKTTGRKETKPKPDWHFKGMVYQRMTGEPFSWNVITKTKTPGVYTPENEPGLHMPASEMGNRVTDRRIQAVAAQLTHMLDTYGPEEPWPTSAPLDTWRCDWCAWKDKGCAWWT